MNGFESKKISLFHKKSIGIVAEMNTVIITKQPLSYLRIYYWFLYSNISYYSMVMKDGIVLLNFAMTIWLYLLSPLLTYGHLWAV
jgi:hypothetical protein